jgi:hypothetical protein
MACQKAQTAASAKREKGDAAQRIALPQEAEKI